MSERAALRTLVLLAMNVGIAAPLVHAQPVPEIEIACDEGVDKTSKAQVVYTTIVLNSARFAAGIASNNKPAI
jgi:hypothetical protein